MEITPEFFAKLFSPIWLFLGSFPFLLFASTISFIIKGLLFIFLLRRCFSNSRISLAKVVLLIIVVSAMVEDLAWIILLSRKLFIPSLNYRIYSFIARMSWGFFVLKYQSLMFFLECLCQKKIRIRLRHIPFFLVTIFFFLFFVGSSFLNFNCGRFRIETSMMSAVALYNLLILAPTTLLFFVWNLRALDVPKLIKKQVMILMRFLIVPVVIADFLQSYPFSFFPSFISHSYSIIGISTTIMTCAIYYSIRKIMGLRFLDFHKHVRATKRFGFIHDFKKVIGQFASVSSERELVYITKNFFKDAFSISPYKVRLHICQNNDQHELANAISVNQECEEIEFLAIAQQKLFIEKRIIIADEISFDNFYKDDKNYQMIFDFLEKIGVDILIPLYNKEDSCVGYVVVEKGARTNKNKEFYSDVERDQMLLFATYLGNTICLLQNKNINLLIAERKELKEELYDKHQKLNQYHESIKTFLRDGKERKIGIIFYKNRRFSFGNHVAADLIQINVNTYAGHPTSKALKKVVRQALEYKTQQTGFAYDCDGKQFILTAIPNLEQNSVIVSTHYPEVADVLQKKINLLRDPTKWDYLLYLETTESGKLVNKIIPGTSETILNFKIDLLKAALSKRPILLDVPQADLQAMAELLHSISLRERMEILELHEQTSSADACIKLFGSNPLFNLDKNNGKPLLEKLNKFGILFIQNIDFLPIEAQELLAQFIKYGFYCFYKTDQKRFSDVRIICSVDKDLKLLVKSGQFSKQLFSELVKTKLVMPSLFSLSQKDFGQLANDIAQQAAYDNSTKHLFELSEKEKQKIVRMQPTSIQELKKRVGLLIKKKKETSGTSKTTILSDGDDEVLEYALQLGKNALKDKEIMEKLWKHFKNQNKIATFLGVNRSSVNRRCKEYGLIS